LAADVERLTRINRTLTLVRPMHGRRGVEPIDVL